MGWFNSILNFKIPTSIKWVSLSLVLLIITSLTGCLSSNKDKDQVKHEIHFIASNPDTLILRTKLSKILNTSISQITLKPQSVSKSSPQSIDSLINKLAHSPSTYLVLNPQELSLIDSSFQILNSRDLFSSTQEIAQALNSPAKEYFNSKLSPLGVQIAAYLSNTHQVLLNSLKSPQASLDSNFAPNTFPLVQFTQDSTPITQLIQTFPDFKDYYLQIPSYNDWIIGLDLSLQGKTKYSGEYILAGVEIALNEINQSSLTRGYKLRALPLNNSGFPDRGLDNLKSLLQYPKLLAVFAGMHSQTALLQLPVIEEKQVPFLIPWAAATPLIKDNQPNSYAFRLSIRDQLAGKFLVSKLPEESRSKVALILENSLWGKSNFKSMTKALKENGHTPAFVEYFNWGEQSFKDIINHLNQSDIQDILFVGNAPEGEVFFKDLSLVKNKINIYSHWGITGGDFFNRIRLYQEKFNLKFIQTFTESQSTSQLQKQFFKDLRLKLKLKTKSPLVAPAGAIHAYELTHLLNQAIQKSKRLTHRQIRSQLKSIKHHPGLFKAYRLPFADLNEALDINDYTLCQFDQHGHILETHDK